MFSFIVAKYAEENSTSRIKRWLFFVKKPLRFGSLDRSELDQLPDEERPAVIQHEILLRLLAVYLLVVVFFLSNILGNFYHVLGDVAQDVGNAGSDDIRQWSAIVLNTPFSAGWVGSFPWYGYGLWPPAYLDVYHEPWNWILHTSALADNPVFFSNMAIEVLLVPIIFGSIILIPLARRSVRESFIPSYLHLNVGMMVFSSVFFNCLAEVVNLFVLSNPIAIGSYVVTAENLAWLLPEILTFLVPGLLLMFLLFFGLSMKLGSIHYPDSKKYKWLFVGSIMLVFFLSMALAFVV